MLSVIKMNFSFGEKVRMLREELFLSQTELGKKVNMTQRKISYLECEKFEPCLDDIRALCNFFKVSADYLLSLPSNYNYPTR